MSIRLIGFVLVFRCFASQFERSTTDKDLGASIFPPTRGDVAKHRKQPPGDSAAKLVGNASG